MDLNKFLPAFLSTGPAPSDELLESYRSHALRYAESLLLITAKKVYTFKSAKIPVSNKEKNIGLILMTLFAAFVDPAIRLTNDKASLFDKSWTTGVLPYFQNCGRVIQNLKKLKDSLDYHAGNEKNWFAVFSNPMQRELLKMYEEVNASESQRSSLGSKREQEEAIRDMLQMTMVILERIELHNEYRAMTFGTIPTMNITVKVDSKADTSLGVVVNPVMIGSFAQVDSMRLTHDTERLK